MLNTRIGCCTVDEIEQLCPYLLITGQLFFRGALHTLNKRLQTGYQGKALDITRYL